MAFLELYCQSGGSNLNAGSTTSPAATYTGVGDSDGTSVFTPSDGSTPASTVSVGMLASVYVTAGATVAVFVGRITAVAAGVNGAITFSTTAKVGTFPAASGGAHTITCKVGGAWAGPAGAVGFPFGFIAGTLTDASGNTPRVNFLAGTYSPTATLTHAAAGPVQFEGYATTPGDGGRAVFDGGEPGASFTILSNSGLNNTFENLTFQRNGSTGTGSLACVVNTGNSSLFRRCVFNTCRGNGVTLGAGAAVECEAFACNVSNTANMAGFALSTGSAFCLRCYAHGCTGGNNSGLAATSSGGALRDCVADGNNWGVNCTAGGNYAVVGCDFYNNASHGLQVGASSVNATLYAENCNFCNNGGYGVFGAGAATKSGWLVNCAFGAGTAANASGQTANLGSMKVAGLVTLPANATPWNAPATGDFRVTLAGCKGAGQGGFTETSPKAGTQAFPDIGCAPQPVGATPAQLASAVWQDLTGSADFTVPGSIGALLVAGGSAPTAAAIASQVWKDLTASGDFTVTGSIGRLLAQVSAGGFLKADAAGWAGTATQLAGGLPRTDATTFSAGNTWTLSAGGFPGVNVRQVADAPANPATLPLSAVLADGVTHGGPASVLQLQQVVVSNPSGDAVAVAAASPHRDFNATTINAIFAMIAGARSGIGGATETYANRAGAPAVQMVFADTLGNTTSVTYLE